MTDTLSESVDFDPIDPELSKPDAATQGTTETFWSVLGEMQRRCPVVHSTAQGGFSVVTRRDDVIGALQDWETFSSGSGVAPVAFDMGGMEFRLNPIDTDPPYQRSIRKLLNPWFSPGAAIRLEPEARTIANQLIDAFIDRGSCEFMTEFANPFPSLIFFRVILGLLPDSVEQISHCVDRLLAEPENAQEVLFELIPWCGDILEDRKKNRRDDVLDALVHTQIDEGRLLTEQEQLEAFVGAANRDPAVWDDPDTIDVDRSDCGKHSSFGVGPHRCLGSHLARMELRVGFEEILRRLPEVRLDPEQPVRWRNSFSRGPVSLPLLFGV